MCGDVVVPQSNHSCESLKRVNIKAFTPLLYEHVLWRPFECLNVYFYGQIHTNSSISCLVRKFNLGPAELESVMLLLDICEMSLQEMPQALKTLLNAYLGWTGFVGLTSKPEEIEN